MKILIFDFDGTIADTLPLYLDILYKGRTSSRSSLTPEQMAALRKLPLLKAVGRLDVPHLSRLRLLWVRWRRLHNRIQDANSFEGLPQAIAELHKRGHKLYILSSNYERNVRAFLRAHNLERYFDGVYHTYVLRKKRGLQLLMQHEALESRSAYYIANEPMDMRAARGAGIRAVAVTWSGQDARALAAEHPTKTIDAPKDLLKLFPPR